MTYIILIDKTGTIKELNIKKFSEEDLYKKAGFKNSENFKIQHNWENVKTSSKTFPKITLFAKTKGNAGKENKYDLPPPIDNVLYFGTIVLIHWNEDGICDLRKNDWESIYETMFGGFEDITNEEEEEEEEEEVDPSLLTKQGYKKDDFIVDDDEIEYEEDYDPDEELEYESELSEEEYLS